MTYPSMAVIKAQQTRMQQFTMVVDYCQSNVGAEWDAIQAAANMKKDWGFAPDWHIFGDAMESLEIKGRATRVGFGADRMVVYRITGGGQ